jgi:hypothetical protein
MKRILMNCFLAFGLVVTPFLSTPVSAQSNPATADVPFSFVVGNQRLAAGQYYISQTQYDSPVFVLRNERGGSIFTQMNSRQEGNPAHPSLTFRRTGSDWTLVKITPPDSAAAYALPDHTKQHSVPVAAMVSIAIK